MTRAAHVGIPVSLRGSLAAEAVQKIAGSADPQGAVEQYVQDLLRADTGDVLHYVEGDAIVIGRMSERGLFPPDW